MLLYFGHSLETLIWCFLRFKRIWLRVSESNGTVADAAGEGMCEALIANLTFPRELPWYMRGNHPDIGPLRIVPNEITHSPTTLSSVRIRSCITSSFKANDSNQFGETPAINEKWAENSIGFHDP